MKKPGTTTRRNGTVRCAIYTRKSSEEGLEQEFNSLQAQREACEAFIDSQRHEGWICLRATGFQLLPRRWVVERTLAWLNRNRRLAKDFEATIASAKAWVYIASVQLLIRRLA